MTLWPGDVVGGFEVERLVAIQGLEGCTNMTCTRLINPDTGEDMGCVGYHCPVCDAPTGWMGHDCPKLRVEERE